MKRSIIRIPRGESQILVTVRFEGDEGPQEGVNGYRAMMTLLQTVANTPDLIRCEKDCPDSLRVYYQSGHWMVESYSIVSRPPDTDEQSNIENNHAAPQYPR